MWYCYPVVKKCLHCEWRLNYIVMETLQLQFVAMIHDTLFIGLHQALAVISLCCSPLIKLNYRCQRVTMIILELKKNQNPTRWSPVTQWKCVAWSLPAENPPSPCVYLISHYLLCLGRLCALEILEKDKWSLSLITGLSITDALFINPKRQRLTTWEWVSINQSILKGVFTNRNWQIPHSVSLSHRLNKSSQKQWTFKAVYFHVHVSFRGTPVPTLYTLL